MNNPRAQLERFRKGVEILGKEIPATTKCLFDFIQTAQSKGALSVREKELIAIGISIHINCDSCLEWHIRRALNSGATKEDIIESIGVGIEMGGGPATVNSRFAMKVLEYYTRETSN